MELVVRNKMAAYQGVKGSLSSAERKQTGSLGVKALHDVVRKDHFIMDSEYLQTLLVVVPKASENEFLNVYERWSSLVVPRSAQVITRDEESILFGVVVFKKVLGDVMDKARENKYIPRDYVYNEEAIEAERREMSSLGATARDQKTSLLRLFRTNFSEVFAAWIHLKMLRVYVEAVLRYGLPPDFQVMAVFPPARQEKKVRHALNQQYAHIGPNKMSTLVVKTDEYQDEVNALLLDSSDYHPYVSFDLKWSH